MQKAIFYLICSCLFIGCSNESSKNDVTHNNINQLPLVWNDSIHGELWAEQVRAITDATKPDDYTAEDWKAVSKFLNKEKIINSIISAVLNGKRKAYHAVDDSTLLSVEEVNSIIQRVDTAATGNQMRASLIDNILFKENWYFNEETFSIKKQVTSVSLAQKVMGDDGSFRGYRVLFWVKTNN